MKTFTHLQFSFLLMMVALLGFASVADAQTGNVALFQDGPNATRFTGTVPRFYLNPAEVQSSGVQVEMVVVGLENASIDEYGIIWSENARPDYYKNNGRQALSMPMTEGNHTYLIKGLRQKGVYFAYGYVVIKGVMFISNEISFENSMLAAGMSRAASRASAAVTGCGTVSGETVFVNKDNENNYGTGVPDNDLDVMLYNDDAKHPIEVNVEVNQIPQMDGYLAIYALDVDEEPNADGLREVDGVYFNGTRIGALSGNNDTWNTTTFRIPKETIKKGKNLVQVKVDELNQRWCVQVKWVQLLINGGVGDKGSIGELTINSAEKSGSTVNVKIAADIKVCTPSNFAIETNLIAPDQSNVYTAKTSFSASSDVDNKELNLQLPLGSMTGTYTANFYLFDNTAGVMLHSASINIEHKQNVGVDPLVVAITPSTELETENPVILTCRAKSVIPSQAKITGIQAPGASAHNGQTEALYTAWKNGTYTFKVYYTQDGTAKTKDFSYTVSNLNLKSQTISWSQDLQSLKVGEPFTLVATASSGKPVAFSMPANENATLAGSVLTFKKAGKAVTVTASQEGGNGFEPATSLVKNIQAQKGSSENVEFPSIGGGGGSTEPVVPGKTITFPTKTDDGRNITYTITPSDAGTQKTEDGKVLITINKAGEATITATIAPTADYEEIKKDFPVTVAKGNQTITWNDDLSAVQVNKPVTLAAKSSVTGMVVTYESSDASIATITEGSKLTVLQANKDVVIKAIQKGDANYNPAATVEKTVKAAKGENAITWNQAFADVKVDEPIELPALTSTAGMNVVYSSSDPLIATVTQKDGKTYLTFLQINKEVKVVASAGTGDANYEEAKVEKTVKATKKGSKPNVEFPDISGEAGGSQPEDKPSVDKSYEYPAETNDGRDIIYTINPADAATQTKEDDKVIISLDKAGDITITATIGGTPDYEEIVTVIPVKVEKCNQVITWNQDLSALQVNVPVALNAVSDKGLPIIYKSSDEASAIVSEGKLTVLKFNTEVTVIATQAGNDNYNAAQDVALKAKAIQKGNPSIDADYPVIEEGLNAPKVDEPIGFPARTDDGRNIVYTITPENAGKQETKEGKVIITITEAVDVKVTATIQGGADYEDVVKEFPIKTQKGTQTITWNQDLSALQVNVPFTLNAVSNKSLPIIYKSLNTSVATVDGNKLTVLKYNAAVEITANQVGNDNYNAAPEVKLTAKATQKGDPSVEADYPVIEEGANAPKVDEPIVFPAQTKDGRDIVYAITPQNAGKQETKDGKVEITIMKAVDVTVTATIQGGADYKDVVKEFPVKTQKGNQTITWTQDLSALQVNVPFTLNAVSNKSLPIIYKSSDELIAKIVEGKLTMLKYNKEVEITANQSGNDDYNSALEMKLIAKAVQKGVQTITWSQTFDRVKVGEVIELKAVSSQNIPVVYTSANAEVATVENNQLTFHKYDVDVVITAKASNDDFVEALSTKTLKANVKGTPSIDAEYPTIEEGEKAPKPGDELIFPGKTEDGQDIIYEISPVGSATQEKKDDDVIITIEKNTEITIEAIVKGDGVDTEDNIKEIIIGVNQKGAQALSWDQSISDLTVGDKLLLTATTTSGRSITYTLSDQTCGKITDDYYLIPAKAMASVTLTAIVNEDDDYLVSNQLEKVFAIKPLVIDDNKDLGEITIPEGLEEEIIVTVTETGNVKLSSSDNEEKTIKQLVVNQKDNEVGSVYTDDHTNIYPSILTLKAEFTPGMWHFISMPFDIDLSGLGLKYSEDYVVAYYDAEQRAKNKRDNWKVIPTATILKAGQGYLIRVMKDNLVFNFSTNDQTSIRGALTFDDINKPLIYEDNEGKASAYNSGWNFVGVPYLSEYLAEPSDKILYVYDEDEQNYVVVSKDMDIKSMTLRPWSAFLLQSGSTSDALMFTADSRIAPGNRAMAYARESVSADRNRFVIELRTKGRIDRTFVVLEPDAHKEYVINEDAAKFFSMDNECPHVYTLAGDGSVALNKLPEQNTLLPIDLIASAVANSECEIVLTEKPLGFKDVILSSSSIGQIKLEENKPFAFTSVGENNFKLIVSRGTVNIGENELNSVSVYVANNNIIMKGLPSGAMVRVASATGELLYMDSALSDESVYKLPEHGVYLVALSVNGLEKVFKVIY